MSPAGRRGSPILGIIDDISGACIGIRQSVGALAARLRSKLSPEDIAELQAIIDLSHDIQAYHAQLRAQESAHYQSPRAAAEEE